MHADAKLARDYVSERSLAEARRSRQQDVIEDLATLARGGNRHAQHALGTLLSDEFLERLGAQRLIEAPILFHLCGRRYPRGVLLGFPGGLTFHRTAPPAIFVL